VGPQDGLGIVAADRSALAREPHGDPGRLGPALVIGDVPVVPRALHEDDGDEPATGDDPDDQQPPLELGHYAARRRLNIERQSRLPRR
jgi:hypothetical protein